LPYTAQYAWHLDTQCFNHHSHWAACSFFGQSASRLL
jgi:hypothetical protein